MRRKFDNDFKRNAVQKVLDGQSGASVAREFGIGENLIYKWKQKFLNEGDGVVSGQQLKEMEALRKENLELRQENEILKKATLIFGNQRR